MSSLAIIPARGGSKRIPRKNIREFMGKPIIAYSIEAAKESGLFSEIMVSTDDDEIATIAEKFGATVPFRRSMVNSGDSASTMDVILEVLEDYKSREHKTFEKACCIYPCAPLIRVGDLVQSFRKLEHGNAASSFPVVPFSYPIWRSLKKNNDGFIEMNWPEHKYATSQSLPVSYHDAGMFYSFDIARLLETRDLFVQSSPVMLDEMSVQDIDNESDWKLAELKWKLMYAKV